MFICLLSVREKDILEKDRGGDGVRKGVKKGYKKEPAKSICLNLYFVNLQVSTPIEVCRK